MNGFDETLWTLDRKPDELIRFMTWMRSRALYRCGCGAYYAGPYKPVGMCPACGAFVRERNAG